jgi:aspartyl-tRNA(Asn)/glutamyl-tRNA(Gln) amidotransferase subunit C
MTLSAGEAETLGRQFEDILKYIAQLNEVPVDGVEPVCHPFGIRNVFREDDPVPADAAFLTRLAPRAEKNMIQVPKIIDGK